MTPRRLPLLCAAATLAVVLAGCGGTTSTAGAPPAAPAASASADDATTADDSDETADDDSDDTTAAGAKVSANTASEDEISDALEQAGVSNPDRWAEEVVEYRPYPADDPNLTKLRDNLAKYNPGQTTVDQIVSALTP
jgi:hypothetical protein